MRNILIGGLITLVATALVQVMIIPWVQRRTRRRERWEDDVAELQTLLDEELPRLLRQFSWESIRCWEVSCNLDFYGEEELATVTKILLERTDPLVPELWRAYRLTDRVALVNHSAPQWQHLRKWVRGIDTAVLCLDPHAGNDLGKISEESFDRCLRGIKACNDKASELLRTISSTMRPPKRRRPWERVEAHDKERWAPRIDWTYATSWPPTALGSHSMARKIMAETVAEQRNQPSGTVTPSA